MQDKVAIVMPGEGARGSAQAKILDTLIKEQGIRPSAIYGVSSGAINAAGYTFLGAERVCDLWSQLNSISKVFQFNFLTFPFASGVFNLRPIRKIVEKEFPKKFIASIPASIAVMHRSTTKIEWINSHDVSTSQFREAVLSAISIPGLVQPAGDHVDAGPRLIAPLLKPIEDGYRKIIVVSGSPVGSIPQRRQGKLFPALAEGLNFMSTMLDEIMIRDIKKALEKNGKPGYEHIDIDMYTPSEYLFDALDFSEVQKGLDCRMIKADLSDLAT